MALTIEELITKDYGTGPDSGYFHNEVTVDANDGRKGTKFELTVTNYAAMSDNTFFTLFVNGKSHEFESDDHDHNAEFLPAISNDSTATSIKNMLNNDTTGNSGGWRDRADVETATVDGNVVTFYATYRHTGVANHTDTLKLGLANGTAPMSGITIAVTPPTYEDISDTTEGNHFAIAFPETVSANYASGGSAAKVLQWLCERLRQAQIADGQTGSNLLTHRVAYNHATGKVKMKYNLTFEVGFNHLSDQTTEKLEDSSWGPAVVSYTPTTVQ